MGEPGVEGVTVKAGHDKTIDECEEYHPDPVAAECDR